MRQFQAVVYFRYLWRSLFILSLLVTIACGGSTTQIASSQTPAATAKPVLPGQKIWKQNVSSFLFGTNDTYEWLPNNIQTQPKIQQALRNAGFSLIRTFFSDKASDADINKRVQTIENSGAQCLGVITNISNPSFDEHLVKFLGSRCQLYEFGNEPDLNGISIQTYLQQWNKEIPRLRQINPTAKFIGPVTYNDQGNHGYMQNFLEGVAASKVLPDAVSFHWYPCYQDTKESCLGKANTYSQVAQGVRSLVRSILGKDIPVGITEWNYDPGNPPPSYGDDQQFITEFTSAALQSMIQGGVAFACQFDAASYSGYGRLDMFDLATNQPKPQYYAIANVIKIYNPSPTSAAVPTTTVPTAPQPTAPASSKMGALLSRGKPVYCSHNDAGAGGDNAIVNGHYGNWSFWRPSFTALPSWCAINVGAGATRLLMTWNSDYIFDYISDTGTTPQDYTIAVSADSTNGADGTWHTLVTVTGNQARIREHLLPFSGQSWVKMTITKGQAKASQPYIFIDQVDLYDVSQSLNDTFFFSGDSITGIAYNRSDDNQPSYAELVHAAYPQRFPTTLDGGLGGWNTDGAVQDIDQWLKLNPDIHYWLLGWGTNDAFDQVSPAHFQANLQILVDKIKQAGHIPILAHIPYLARPDLDSEVQSLNAAIDKVTEANHLTKGPDFYQLFHAHAADYLLKDGTHPTPAGAKAMNQAWFQLLRPILYG